MPTPIWNVRTRPTLREFYDAFVARQVWVPTTRRSMDHAITTCPFLNNDCGVEPAARIHDARHLYASEAIANGEDIVRVQGAASPALAARDAAARLEPIRWGC